MDPNPATLPPPPPPPPPPPASLASLASATPGAGRRGPAGPHGAATPWRTCLGLLWPLALVLLAFVLLLVAAAGGVRWLLSTEPGSQWLLQHAPLVRATGFKGAVLGDTWSVDRLEVRWGSRGAGLVLEDLRADGLRFRWRPSAQAWLGVQADHLSARQLTLNTGASAPSSTGPAQHIVPPLQVAVNEVRLGEFTLDGARPWQHLAIDAFSMDPQAEAGYQGEHLAFEAWGLAIEGRARLGPDAPLALSATATVRPLMDGERPRWAARLNAQGSLAQLELDGILRGVPVPLPAPAPGGAARRPAAPGAASVAAGVAREAPWADLQATLHPLLPWKLAALKLHTQALDASALWAGAPATRLAGQAELGGGAHGLPLNLALQLDNALPGRWNEGRLPLHKLQLDARSALNQPQRVDLTRFELAWADAAGPAGQLGGSAVWQGHELTLDAVLTRLSPQHLDSRAAAMSLSGPVALTLRGLPSPDYTGADHSPIPAPSLRWKLDLQGQLDARPQPVQLLLEGLLDDQHLDLSRVRAQAGGATADLQASLSRNGPMAKDGDGGWTLATRGEVQNFDPLPWWPGEAGAAWRKGPHRFSGDWQLDARLPTRPAALPLLAWVQRVAGNGRLALRDSLLAGVPLSADVALSYGQAAGTAVVAAAASAPRAASRPDTGRAPGAATGMATLQALLHVGGNTLSLVGRGDPVGSGTGAGDGDRLRLEVQAEQLASWAPLTRLDPALADWVPRQGSASAVVLAEGRWPALHTEGDIQLSQLQAGKLRLARGNATWQLDLRGPGAAQQPLSLQLEAIGLQLGEQAADHLRADLHGTMADHRIELSGAMPVNPSPPLAQLLGVQAQAGSRVRLQAQGAWRPDAAGGGRWQARIAQLRIGTWDGSPEAGAPSATWAEASDLKADLRFDGKGQLMALQAEPGRVRLGDALSLRWDAVAVDLQREPVRAQLHADIETFSLAPLLARVWPAMGWQGDLRLAARVDVRAGDQVEADLVFERRDGDLHASSAEGVQLMGLTEFRLALAVHDGLWTFTPQIQGRSLGALSGQARVQTTPDRRWPEAQSPLSGKLQLQVADIGIWGAWVPPGWRLGGELRSTATLGGTFGQPQYTGELVGQRLSLRNLLEGVNLSDGQLLLKLGGESATIERFTLKGGDGQAQLTGGLRFGPPWQIQARLQAERFRVLGRVDRNLTVSGQSELNWRSGQTQLEGRFTVDEGLFDASRSGAPTLDEDVSVRRATSTDEGPAEPVASGPKLDFLMGLDIDLGDKLRVKGLGLDTRLRGQLRATAPGGRLAVNGTIRTEGGTFNSYGQKLELERGNVYLSGDLKTPRLDVLALRPNLDTRVGVQITGNWPTPRIRLYSDPELSDADKLAWLMTGRAPDSLGRNDTALLQRAALALLSGEGEAPTDTLLNSLGLTDLNLRQGDTDARETIISLGRQINRRVYVGYERGINATAGNFQLIYRIAQRFTLRLQTGLDSSLDVLWTSRFQETPADAANRKVTVPAR